MLKGICLQIKLGEIFWGEVKIDALNGGGDACIREMIILFYRRQIAKVICGY